MSISLLPPQLFCFVVHFSNPGSFIPFVKDSEAYKMCDLAESEC